MAITTVERPTTVIKNIVAPISSAEKTQSAAAVQEIVNRIKAKHL